MSEKIQRTTFGVMTSHVISSSTLFPVFWLIAGSIGKAMLVAKDMINETLANGIYYAVMLLFFYFGTKYSLYYINKKVSVTMPKQSGQQSIILFTALVIATNYGLFYFEDSINIMRIFFSLQDTEHLECTFIGQMTVLSANLSMLISLVVLFAIFSEITPLARYALLAVILILSLKTEIFNKTFVPFFYKKDEPKPIKYALTVLAITLPLNVGLYFVVINYFEKFVV